MHVNYFTYAVEEASLGTELDSTEDGEVEAVEGADTACLRRVDIGALRVANVLNQPHGAESLLEAVGRHQTLLSALLPPLLLHLALLPLLVLALLSASRWLEEVELASDLDDLVPVVVL